MPMRSTCRECICALHKLQRRNFYWSKPNRLRRNQHQYGTTFNRANCCVTHKSRRTLLPCRWSNKTTGFFYKALTRQRQKESNNKKAITLGSLVSLQTSETFFFFFFHQCKEAPPNDGPPWLLQVFVLMTKLMEIWGRKTLPSPPKKKKREIGREKELKAREIKNAWNGLPINPTKLPMELLIAMFSCYCPGCIRSTKKKNRLEN